MPHRQRVKARCVYYHFDTSSRALGGGGTDIFCASLREYFEAKQTVAEMDVIWLRPNEVESNSRVLQMLSFVRYLVRDLVEWVRQRSDYYIFVYPKLPVMAFTDKPELLRLVRWVWNMWARWVKARGARIVVIVEDLPAEQGFSLEVPPAARLSTPANRLERAIFRLADRIISPSPRFSRYIAAKHGVDERAFRLFRRNIYLPQPGMVSQSFACDRTKINLFYAGGIDARLHENFRQLLAVVARYPSCYLWVCGHGQALVQGWIDEAGIQNARHVGVLTHQEHDALAQQCDVGLLLYPRSFYNDMTPTMKYTGYAANGLAILSTDLATVAENLVEDGIGEAVPVTEFAARLGCWLEKPEQFAGYRHNARQLMASFREGRYMAEWFVPLVERRDDV